jgi:hypothetical protein
MSSRVPCLLVLLLAACTGTATSDDTDVPASGETDGGGSTDTEVDLGPDEDGDGVPRALDCNDLNPLVRPGADEICNGADDDCDEKIDRADKPFPGGIGPYFKDEDVDGFGGDGELMQKFGIEIRDSCTFLISRNRWTDAVAAGRDTQLALPNRPAEADIIYLPMTRSYLEIKKVDTHDPFYQLGKLYVYKVQCELIQYSGEKFDTGNAEVDSIEDELSLDSEIYGLTLETGGALLLDSLLYDDLDAGRLLQEHTMNIEVQDKQANNLDIRRLAVDILDFSEVNPFGEVI